jgi:hypothetical protein
MQRRKIMVSLNRSRIAESALHVPVTHFESESRPKIGLPSPVDRSGSEWKSLINPGRIDVENSQDDPETSIGWRDSRAAALLCERGELLPQGKSDDRLLASTSNEGRNTAKEDRREFEQLPHSEAHSDRNRHRLRD